MATQRSGAHWAPSEIDAQRLTDLVRASRLTVLCGGPDAPTPQVLQAGVLPRVHRRAEDRGKGERPSAAKALPSEDRRQGSSDPEVSLLFDQWDVSARSALRAALQSALKGHVASRGGKLPQRFGDLLIALSERRQVRFLLLFDRFEDCLLAPPESADLRALRDEIFSAVNRPQVPAHFLLTLREDGEPLLDRLRGRIRGFEPVRKPFPLDGAKGIGPWSLSWVPPVLAPASARPPQTRAVYASIEALLGQMAQRAEPLSPEEEELLPPEADALRPDLDRDAADPHTAAFGPLSFTAYGMAPDGSTGDPFAPLADDEDWSALDGRPDSMPVPPAGRPAAVSMPEPPPLAGAGAAPGPAPRDVPASADANVAVAGSGAVEGQASGSVGDAARVFVLPPEAAATARETSPRGRGAGGAAFTAASLAQFMAELDDVIAESTAPADAAAPKAAPLPPQALPRVLPELDRPIDGPAPEVAAVEAAPLPPAAEPLAVSVAGTEADAEPEIASWGPQPQDDAGPQGPASAVAMDVAPAVEPVSAPPSADERVDAPAIEPAAPPLAAEPAPAPSAVAAEPSSDADVGAPDLPTMPWQQEPDDAPPPAAAAASIAAEASPASSREPALIAKPPAPASVPRTARRSRGDTLRQRHSLRAAQRARAAAAGDDRLSVPLGQRWGLIARMGAPVLAACVLGVGLWAVLGRDDGTTSSLAGAPGGPSLAALPSETDPPGAGRPEGASMLVELSAAGPLAQGLADELAQALPPGNGPALLARGTEGWARDLGALRQPGRLAIAREDALQAARADASLGPLQIVLPLFSEELVFVVRADSPLRYIHQIEGQRLGVGEPDSARAHTVGTAYQQLFGRPLPAEKTDASDEPEALSALLDGRIDVVALVGTVPGAWPVPPALTDAKQLRLLQLDRRHPASRRALKSMAAVPLAAGVDGLPAAQPTTTLAVRSYLVAGASPGSGANANDLGGLARALCRQLPVLQREGHAKWREVRLGAMPQSSWPYAPEAAFAMQDCASRQPARL